jgi:hypothetical protein
MIWTGCQLSSWSYTLHSGVGLAIFRISTSEEQEHPAASLRYDNMYGQLETYFETKHNLTQMSAPNGVYPGQNSAPKSV